MTKNQRCVKNRFLTPLSLFTPTADWQWDEQTHLSPVSLPRYTFRGGVTKYNTRKQQQNEWVKGHEEVKDPDNAPASQR